jgi:lipopolysaccharide export system permease protein
LGRRPSDADRLALVTAMTLPPVAISLYVSRHVLTAIAGVFFSCVGLIYLIDFVEMLRRASGHDDVGFGVLALMAAYRTPAFSEQVLPFAVLIGTMAALLNLSRRNELVIARAAGMSVWHFLTPGIVVTFLLGVLAVTVYNPLAAYFSEAEARLEATSFGASESLVLRADQSGVWLRQEGVDGQTVMRADRSREKGVMLDEVTAFAFDSEQKFVERIEAKTATLKDGFWDLEEAWVLSSQSEPQFYENYLATTYLTRAQVEQTITDPKSVAFWDLPSFIDLAGRAGLATEPYRQQWHLLLSRPLVLVAMVVIAAIVSLRSFRFGGVGLMMLAGIAAGFLFYAIAKLMSDLGSAGLVAPAAAAWMPVIVVTLAGLTILLYQEDG